MIRSSENRRLALAWAVLLGWLIALATPAQAQTLTSQATYPGGGGKNVVIAINHVDQNLRVNGNVQLNRIPGPSVSPLNQSIAYASCTNCQTLAVALQIDLISRTASQITPANLAVAANDNCTNCYTAARALQYVIQVDDPTAVPPDVMQLEQQMEVALKSIQGNPNLTVSQAEGQIDGVISQFQELAGSLSDQRSETSEPSSPNTAAVKALIGA